MLQNKNSLVLLDGNALMHRAYHGINRGFVPVWNNMPVGMVYGFASTVLSLIEHLRPERLVVAFDTKEPTFRHKLDSEYKAHRKPTPDDFYDQVPLVDELLTAFNIRVIKMPGFEADDICGSLAVQGAEKGVDAKIVSGDLDYSQLLTDKIHLVKLNGKIDQSPIYTPAEVKARFGVTTDQMVDFKALVGDSSDNFKGLSGCGPKTAAEWLQRWGTLSNIFDHKEELSSRWKEKLENEKDYVMQCRVLSEIKTDIDINYSWDEKFTFSSEGANDFLGKMNFKSLQGRLMKMNKKLEQPISKEQKDTPKKNEDDGQMALF